MHSHRTITKPVISIVGGDTLLGKEVMEVLASSGLGAQVKLIASLEGVSILSSAGDEPLAMIPLEAADFEASRVVILAGSPEVSQKAFGQIRGAASPPAVIDVSGGLEHEPDARLRAPMVDTVTPIRSGAVQTIAHPASVALALLLTGLGKAGVIRRAVVNVFEPVSERGQAGLDELQKQTVSLLSLKPLAKEVFDTQVSFNMLSRYGSDSRFSLEETERKIDRHLASLLAASGAMPMPSLRLIQAPVFHGYSVSAWVEFEVNPGPEAIALALESKWIDVRGAEHESPTNVGVAGQTGIVAGDIVIDGNQPRACWLWAVADNLRMAAENAAEVARELLR